MEQHTQYDEQTFTQLLSKPHVMQSIRSAIKDNRWRDQLRSEYNPFVDQKVEDLPHLKADLNKFKANCKATDKIFDSLLQSFTNCLKQDKKMVFNNQFKAEMTKFSPKIKEYAEKGNAKALCLMGIIYRWGIGTAMDLVKSGEYTKKSADQGYPKGIFCYASHLQDIERNKQEALKYFQIAADYRQELALVVIGFHYSNNMNFSKAYSYYMIAGDMGNAMAYNKIGQCYLNGVIIIADYQLAIKYFKKASQLGFEEASQNMMTAELQLQQQQTQNQLKQQYLKTTKVQQALLIADFIERLRNTETLGIIPYSSWMKIPAPNLEVPAYNVFKKGELTFFNLCESLDQRSKNMLVEDKDGNIEKICVYNWEKLPKKKLDLLKLPGTQFVLKYFNRKKAGDALPIYRIDNPDTMQIHPPIKNNQHTLTLEKVRQAARELFSALQFDKCILLYTHMLQKNYTDKILLYSNISICYLKLQKFTEAKKYAKRCLKLHPSHLKSLYMVAKTLYKLNKLDEAMKAVDKLPENNESLELKEQIEQKLKIQKEYSDFSVKNYRKMAVLRKKKLNFTMSMQKVASIQLNMLAVFPFFEGCQEYIKSKLSFEGKDFKTEIKQLVQSMITWRIANHNPKTLKKIVILAYELIKLFHTQIQFTGNSYAKSILNGIFDIQNFDPTNNISYFLKIMSDRLGFLQNQVETAAIELQGNRCFQQAVDLYSCFSLYNSVFALNRSEILRQLSRYEEAEDLCLKMIEVLQEQAQPITDFAINTAKCKRSRQMFKQSIEICEQLFANKVFNAAAYHIVSLNYLSLGDVDRSLTYAYKSTEKGVSFEHTMNLCRLLKQANKDQEALKRLNEIYSQNRTSQDINSKIWIKACLNLKIQLACKRKDKVLLIECCIKVINQDIRNVGFVEEKFWGFIKSNPEQSDQILKLIEQAKELQFISEQLNSRWKLFRALSDSQNINQESIVKDYSDAQQTFEKVDPKEVHQYFLEIKRKAIGDQAKLNQQQMLDIDEKLDRQFTGYKHSFQHNGKLHVILFSQKLGLDPRQEQQFLLAVSKGFCNRFFGCNGIKHIKDHYEVKINSGHRLIGKAEENNNRCIIVFAQKVSHDKVALKLRQA